MTRSLPALLLLFALLPGSGSAQARECEVFHTGTGTSFRDQGMTFLGGGVRFVCPGGVRIRSDSLAHIEFTGLAEFIGNVHYADSLKTLTSAYAQYVGRESRISARDNVVLTDLRTGSTIHAPFLDYFQENETRPESMVLIYSGRPHAVLVRKAEAAVPPDTAAAADTTVVDSDQMQIFGERLFVGRGNVELTRGTMKGYGNEATFDQLGDSLRLAGMARVVTEDYLLSADTIGGLLTEGEQFREVDARRQAKLESDELQAEAPRLRIFFEDGEVQRMVGIGDRPVGDAAAPPPVSGMPAAGQARANSADFRLVADSIDALAPGQRLERVVAVGAAFGERTTPDSVAATRPPAAARDWMRGDTIIAMFITPPATEPDTAQDPVLDSITTVGVTDQARSLYAMPDENDPAGRLAYSYLLAHRIHVTLRAGEVATVNAEGKDGQPVHGLYLQPSDSTQAPPPRRAGGGTRR